MSEPDRRKAFGARLRRLRKERNMKQRQLAGKIGVVTDTICNWEKGHSYPQRPAIFRLARALACDRTWLEGIPGAIAPAFLDDQETVSP